MSDKENENSGMFGGKSVDVVQEQISTQKQAKMYEKEKRDYAEWQRNNPDNRLSMTDPRDADNLKAERDKKEVKQQDPQGEIQSFWSKPRVGSEHEKEKEREEGKKEPEKERTENSNTICGDLAGLVQGITGVDRITGGENSLSGSLAALISKGTENAKEQMEKERENREKGEKER